MDSSTKRWVRQKDKSIEELLEWQERQIPTISRFGGLEGGENHYVAACVGKDMENGELIERAGRNVMFKDCEQEVQLNAEGGTLTYQEILSIYVLDLLLKSVLQHRNRLMQSLSDLFFAWSHR